MRTYFMLRGLSLRPGCPPTGASIGRAYQASISSGDIASSRPRERENGLHHNFRRRRLVWFGGRRGSPDRYHDSATPTRTLALGLEVRRNRRIVWTTHTH